MDASSSRGSHSCEPPPECEEAHTRHQEQNQWVPSWREGSSSLTPMMRALIELEETKATESRAPCKNHHSHHLILCVCAFLRCAVYSFPLCISLQGSAIRGPRWVLLSGDTKNRFRSKSAFKRREMRYNQEEAGERGAAVEQNERLRC